MVKKAIERWKKMSTENKAFFVIIATLVLAIFVVGGYIVYDVATYRSQLTNAQNSYEDKQKGYQEAQKEVSNLYENDDFIFLKKDVTQENIDAVSTKLESLKYDEGRQLQAIATKYKEYNKKIDKLYTEVEKVQKKFTAQTDVNSLYEEQALNGSKVNSDAAIIENLKSDQVSKIRESYYKKNPGKSLKQGWQRVINSLIEEAESQIKQISEATKAVESIYKNGKLLSGASFAAFDQALIQAEKVKNTKVREELIQQIGEGQQVLKNKDKTSRSGASESQSSSSSNQTIETVEPEPSTYPNYVPPTVPSTNNNNGENTTTMNTTEQTITPPIAPPTSSEQVMQPSEGE